MYFLFPSSCANIRSSKGNTNKNPNMIKESGGIDHEKDTVWEAVQPADRLLSVVLHGLLTGISRRKKEESMMKKLASFLSEYYKTFSRWVWPLQPLRDPSITEVNKSQDELKARLGFCFMAHKAKEPDTGRLLPFLWFPARQCQRWHSPWYRGKLRSMRFLPE